jgi:NDP-sugar pyrophosphorylase family protein
MPGVFSWETDLMQPKAPVLGAAGVILEAPFLDIGTPESYGEAENVLPVVAGLDPPPQVASTRGQESQ